MQDLIRQPHRPAAFLYVTVLFYTHFSPFSSAYNSPHTSWSLSFSTFVSSQIKKPILVTFPPIGPSFATSRTTFSISDITTYNISALCDIKRSPIFPSSSLWTLSFSHIVLHSELWNPANPVFTVMFVSCSLCYSLSLAISLVTFSILSWSVLLLKPQDGA